MFISLRVIYNLSWKLDKNVLYLAHTGTTFAFRTNQFLLHTGWINVNFPLYWPLKAAIMITNQRDFLLFLDETESVSMQIYYSSREMLAHFHN